MQLHTYLNYGGNCEQAFRFYEQQLGGKITMLMRHGEQPTPSEAPPDWNGKVLHARMNLGGTELLGADIPGYQPMRSAYLSLTVSTRGGGRAHLRAAVRWWAGLHADTGDLLCLTLCDAPRPVRNIVDAPSSEGAELRLMHSDEQTPV